MSTDYTNVNGYLVPSFALPTGSTPPLGKYGAMRARFLDEHRPFERDQMLLDGTLAQHLAGVDSEAHNQVSALVYRLAEQHGGIALWNGRHRCKLCRRKPRKSCAVS